MDPRKAAVKNLINEFLSELNKPAKAATKAAPQDEALKLAQQRAALPPSQGGLGLPANNTPEQRAKAMSWNTPGFHATNADIKKFDPNLYGASDYGSIGQGVYIDPSKSAGYANLVASIVGKDKPANVMPLLVREGNVFNADQLPLITNAKTSKEVSKNLKKLGYDSVMSEVNGQPNEMVVFDPDRVRSRFAAFDPFRRDAATAALFGVAAPDLLAREQEKAAGGEVHMDKGGDPMLADLIERYKPTVKKPEPMTARKRLRDELESLLSGSMSPQAVQRISQTAVGGDKSMLPIGIGVADFVPFLGSGMGVEEAARDLPQVYEDLKNKEYLDAAIGAGFDVLGLLPGAAGTAAVGRAAFRKARPIREVHMAGGGAKQAVKKGAKQALDAVGDFLNSINPNDAIAREAARLQTVANPIKASEALSPYEGAYLKLVPYDRMKVDLSGKERGGPNFSGIQLVDPLYANAVSGVTDKKTATRLINKNQNVPEGASVIWTPSVGSPIQHRSNATMFNKFADEFDLAKSGIAPELIDEMNKAASTAVDKKKRLIFPQGMDFNAQNYRRIPQTYDQRRLVADIFSGKGVGGKRGQTVANYDQLILDNTDPLFVDVPNGSIGPRLFTLDNKFEIRPDLHNDYPFVLTGKDLGVTYTPIPREPVFTDFAEAVQAIKERPVTAMDFDRGDPTQLIHRELINRMRDEGHAEGGEVHMDKGGAAKDAVKAAVKDAAEALRGYIDPIANRISDWNWRPMSDVRQDVPLTEIPEYIQGGFGNFMAEQAKRAAAGDLNARDLIKAYTITRSSVNRGGLPYNTATKTGMQLPRTQGLVRPEGAFAEWLGSKAGQRYLDQAVKGSFTESDLEDMVTRFAPFGMPAVLADDMRYAAKSLSPKGATISSDVMASPEVYREVSQQLKGIGPAKSGFMASLLGRGDYPTFDARQIRLHTGQGGKDAAKYMTRGKGVGGEEAVARLADRQRAMDMSLDPSLDPFYQHLVHHTVWDKLGNEQTTHDDLVKAMRGYADGGEVDSDGVTLDEFLSKQGY